MLEKAASLSAENVSLRASADEMAGHKAALEERVRGLEEEIRQK